MVALLLAIAPVMIVLLYIYFKDKFEKEPVHFLFKNFVLGAVLSVTLTVVFGYFANKIFPITDNLSVFQQFVKAFFIVAFVEELSKYLIVKYYAQVHKEFNEPFDGIVYAVTISMGFAALENILYVLQFGLTTGLVRAFTAVPAHAIFGVLMGYFMGKAKFSNNRILLNFVGLIVAVLFHGAYDFFLFIHFIPGITIGAFVSLGLGLFLSRKAIKIHQKNSHFKVS